YRLGTAAEMGPGYFPLIIGGLLVIIGFALVFNTLISAKGDDTKITNFDLKSLVIVTAATVAFGLCIAYLGLVCAVVGLVLISSAASHAFTWKVAFLNASVLAILAVVLFVKGLGVPIAILPPFLQ